MLDRLDRYVSRGLIASWLATLLLVVFLFMVVDLLLKMGKYVNVAEGSGIGVLGLLWHWARFHLLSLPWIFVTVAPFVTVIGTMFAVSRLRAANEVVPMVFTGRGTVRVLLPALALGIAVASAMAVVWELVLPPLSRSIERMRAALEDDRPGETKSLVLRSRHGQSVLMCDRYLPEQERIEGITLVEKGAGPQDRAVVSAPAAAWDAARGAFALVDGKRRAGDLIAPQAELRLDGVTPDVLWMAGKEAEDSSLLAYSELRALLRVTPNRPDLVVGYHYHFTWPLANVVLLLLALPFAVHFERGSKMGRVMLSIAICGSYFLVDLACQNLGRSEFMHPVVAAWTPVVVFGSIGAVMFTGMRT